MAFRDETPAEVAFLTAAVQRYVTGSPARRLYEPGCGGGRLLAAMSAAGFQVTGTDNNPAMVRHAHRRLKRRGLAAEVTSADMRDHVCVPPVDAAFCTFNTFRHLLGRKDPQTHLRAVAASLRVGGIYVLGFHCIPLDADPLCTERWTARHAGTRLSVTLRVLSSDRRRRVEAMRASLKVTQPRGNVLRMRDEFNLRLYTPDQAAMLWKQVRDVFDLVAVHDFDFDINTTRQIDNDLTDAVFILQRKAS